MMNRGHVYTHTNQGEWEPGLCNEIRQSGVGGDDPVQ